MKSNPEDKIIHTTLSKLLGTSVSEIVDEVTAVLDYPGSSNKKINANKSKDYYTKLSSGTLGTTKTYSALGVASDGGCGGCVTTNNGLCYCGQGPWDTFSLHLHRKCIHIKLI